MKRTTLCLTGLILLGACGSAGAGSASGGIASLGTTPVTTVASDSSTPGSSPSDKSASDSSTPGKGGDDGSSRSSGGASVDPGGPVDSAKLRQAMLDNAKCMREHGVDMPDPSIDEGSGGGTITFGPGGVDPTSDDFQAASKACQHLLADVLGGFQPLSAEEQAKMRDEALKFAKCMRDHGINVPDPQFGDGGTIEIAVDGSQATGPTPDSEEFQKASKDCGQGTGFGIAVPVGAKP